MSNQYFNQKLWEIQKRHDALRLTLLKLWQRATLKQLKWVKIGYEKEKKQTTN